MSGGALVRGTRVAVPFVTNFAISFARRYSSHEPRSTRARSGRTHRVRRSQQPSRRVSPETAMHETGELSKLPGRSVDRDRTGSTSVTPTTTVIVVVTLEN